MPPDTPFSVKIFHPSVNACAEQFEQYPAALCINTTKLNAVFYEAPLKPLKHSTTSTSSSFDKQGHKRLTDNVALSASLALWRWLQINYTNLMCQAHFLLITTGGELGHRVGRINQIKRTCSIVLQATASLHSFNIDLAFRFCTHCLAVFD